MTTRTVRRRGVDLTAKATMVNEKAAAKLAKRGLGLPVRPEFDMPRTIRNPTDLDDASLLGLFAELVAWSDYAAAQLAYAAIDERALAETLEVSEANALITGWGGDSSDKVTIARANRDLDEDVQALKAAATEAYAVRKLTETIAANLERNTALVSRELTRRTAGQPVQRRNDRWHP